MIKAAHSPDVTARNLAEYLTAKVCKRMPQWGQKERRPLAMPYKKILRCFKLRSCSFVCLDPGRLRRWLVGESTW